MSKKPALKSRQHIFACVARKKETTVTARDKVPEANSSSSNIKAEKQHHQRPRPQQLSKIKTPASGLASAAALAFFNVPLLIFGLQVAGCRPSRTTATAVSAATAPTCNSTAATFVSSSSSSSTCAASVPRQNVNRCNQALSDSAEAQRGLNFAKYTSRKNYTKNKY